MRWAGTDSSSNSNNKRLTTTIGDGAQHARDRRQLGLRYGHGASPGRPGCIHPRPEQCRPRSHDRHGPGRRSQCPLLPRGPGGITAPRDALSTKRSRQGTSRPISPDNDGAAGLVHRMAPPRCPTGSSRSSPRHERWTTPSACNGRRRNGPPSRSLPYRRRADATPVPERRNLIGDRSAELAAGGQSP